MQTRSIVQSDLNILRMKDALAGNDIFRRQGMNDNRGITGTWDFCFSLREDKPVFTPFGVFNIGIEGWDDELTSNREEDFKNELSFVILKVNHSITGWDFDCDTIYATVTLKKDGTFQIEGEKDIAHAMMFEINKRANEEYERLVKLQE